MIQRKQYLDKIIALKDKKKIPNDIKTKYTNIPSKEMAEMRDVLLHDYFGTDIEVLWQTANKDISFIHKEFKKIIKDIKK